MFKTISIKTKRILAIVLASVCTLLVCFSAIFTYGFGGKKNELGNGDSPLSFGNFFGNGIMLTASAEEVETAANAESTIRLTATITPESASIQTVDWSVSWVDSSSEWATGKTVTDYVTVTPTADGALTADVSCLQAFGEQVKVSVISRDNTDVSADCTVDYGAKRLSGEFSLFSGDSVSHSTEADSIVVSADFSTMLSVTLNNIVWSDYTLANTTSRLSVYLVASDIVSKIAVINEEMGIDVSFDGRDINAIQSSIPTANLSGKTIISLFSRESGNFSSDEGKVVLKKFQKYFYLHPDVSLFSLKISCEDKYSTFERTIPLYFDPAVLYDGVTGVTLDQSNIVF